MTEQEQRDALREEMTAILDTPIESQEQVDELEQRYSAAYKKLCALYPVTTPAKKGDE
jgi:hypothetical protein